MGFFSFFLFFFPQENRIRLQKVSAVYPYELLIKPEPNKKF